ncbi:MAG: hypothetical protein EKK41_18120 [Hyphomicrobiales bacterium]|nr:MAG: hypothetical protein EKK41_18120 [Hyphomicrobiales bacterium]
MAISQWLSGLPLARIMNIVIRHQRPLARSSTDFGTSPNSAIAIDCEFAAFLASLRRCAWVVYAKKPITRPVPPIEPRRGPARRLREASSPQM